MTAASEAINLAEENGSFLEELAETANTTLEAISASLSELGASESAIVLYDPEFAQFQQQFEESPILQEVAEETPKTIEEIAEAAPKVIVELGAGNYKNAIAMKEANPDAIVYATNLRSEWEEGRRIVESYRESGIPIAAASIEETHTIQVFLGWEEAQAKGVLVGELAPFENQDLIDMSVKADLVYNVAPYTKGVISLGANEGAEIMGESAAKIAKFAPEVEVGVTSSELTAQKFFEGFSRIRPGDFNEVSGFPYGRAGKLWNEVGAFKTWIHLGG